MAILLLKIVYTIPYKNTHDFFTACIFLETLKDNGVDTDDIDIDNAYDKLKNIIYELPVIHVSTFNVPEKITPVYSIFISNNINKNDIDLLIHLLENVYGVDGSEEVELYNSKYSFKKLSTLVRYLRRIRDETIKENKL